MIPDESKEAFDNLIRHLAHGGKLALVESTDLKTGEACDVICLYSKDAEESTFMLPVAIIPRESIFERLAQPEGATTGVWEE